MRKNWYSIKNAASAGVLEVSIHDEIGVWGVTAKDLIADVNNQAGVREINISIHSPGGSAFDGLAIYNFLANHPAKVYTSVEGIAASAASIILMAGDVITMPEDAFVMIHNPWAGVVGDAEEMRDTANMLDKIRDSLVSIYQKKTALDESTLVELLDAETWLNGSEAKDYGFVDVITEPVKVAALSKDFAKHFGKLPSALIDEGSELQAIKSIDNMKDLESGLRDAGNLSRKGAKAWVSKVKELVQRDAGADEDAELIQAMQSFKLN